VDTRFGFFSTFEEKKANQNKKKQMKKESKQERTKSRLVCAYLSRTYRIGL
jgi:hypothetical protein